MLQRSAVPTKVLQSRLVKAECIYQVIVVDRKERARGCAGKDGSQQLHQILLRQQATFRLVRDRVLVNRGNMIAD